MKISQNMVQAAEHERQNPQAQFGMSPFADLTASEFKLCVKVEGVVGGGGAVHAGTV